MENENVEKKPMENEEDLVEALKKTKENSVSKEEYQKLKDENKRLIDAFANGETIPSDKEPEAEKSLDELRKDLMNAKTNLDYAKASLALRNKRLKDDGVDDYLPNGANYKPTDQDIASANLVAEQMQKCIEEANGNSAVFTASLQSITDDINLPFKK